MTMFSIFPTRTALTMVTSAAVAGTTAALTNAIIETLENSFGGLKSKSSITDAILSAAENAVEDSKSDYLSELKYAKENSFLDGLDELNIDVEFQQTAEVSIAYIVLAKTRN